MSASPQSMVCVKTVAGASSVLERVYELLFPAFRIDIQSIKTSQSSHQLHSQKELVSFLLINQLNPHSAFFSVMGMSLSKTCYIYNTHRPLSPEEQRVIAAGYPYVSTTILQRW